MKSINPEHVDNFKSVSLMKSQGFIGTDASLAESLFEYGLAWRELDNEILFVYRHPTMRKRFDRCTFSKTMDVKKEFNWVRWPEFLSHIDMIETDWLSLPLPQKIYDLLNYYGTEEIFGSSYWEGFAIAED